MEVLNLTRTYNREDAKKHFYFPFLLNQEYDFLTINMEFSPGSYAGEELFEEIVAAFAKVGVTKEMGIIPEKYLPVNNLLTLSLDGPKGMLGNAHRHREKSTYIISKEKSSPGFFPAKIEKGRYAICVSTHCIASQQVTLKINVKASNNEK